MIPSNQDILIEMIGEYTDRLTKIAESQGFQLLQVHSIYNPEDGQILTVGASSIITSNDFMKTAFLQGKYVARMLDENYK